MRVGKKYILFFLFSSANTRGLIHIIGDSHAFFNFASAEKIAEKSYHSIKITRNQMAIPVSLVIHWLGPRTMYRVGREGLKDLNIKKWGIQEGDVIIYVFGEIDVRCHILKQRDQGRSLDDIIDQVVDRYLDALSANKQQYNSLVTIVCSITPPTDQAENKDFPIYGTLSERIQVTRDINKLLNKRCKERGFLFLDSYPYYSSEDGDLREELSDGSVHIAIEHNNPIRRELVRLLESNNL